MEGSSSRERNSNKNDDNDELARLEEEAALALCDIRKAPPVENSKFLYSIIGIKRSEPIERTLVKGDFNPEFKWLSFNPQPVIPMLLEGEILNLKEKGIEVDSYDTNGIKYEMTFKIKKPGTFVLDGHGWTDFVQNHSLKISDHIKIWMFRHVQSKKLCFVILKNEQVERFKKAPPVENWDFLSSIIGIKCSGPIERKLSKTDVDPTPCFKWLLLNAQPVRDHLIPMLMKGEELEPGVEVDTYDTQGNEYKMTFKTKKPWSVVLGGHGWIDLVKTNKLEEADLINIWIFRNVQSNKLCCLILKNEQSKRFKKARLDNN